MHWRRLNLKLHPDNPDIIHLISLHHYLGCELWIRLCKGKDHLHKKLGHLFLIRMQSYLIQIVQQVLKSAGSFC